MSHHVFAEIIFRFEIIFIINKCTFMG